MRLFLSNLDPKPSERKDNKAGPDEADVIISEDQQKSIKPSPENEGVYVVYVVVFVCIPNALCYYCIDNSNNIAAHGCISILALYFLFCSFQVANFFA